MKPAGHEANRREHHEGATHEGATQEGATHTRHGRREPARREREFRKGMKSRMLRFQRRSSMRPRPLVLALAGLALLSASCARRGAVDPKAPIIIISIDTLRSGHLPAYGHPGVSTPAIDTFRNDSILFQRAYSHCPLPLVSHASVFTGVLPAEHGIRDNLGYDLNPKTHTLAELLKSKGYASGGAVSALVLRGDTGIKRGFDFWDDAIDLDPSALSIGRAQRGADDTPAIAAKRIG